MSEAPCTKPSWHLFFSPSFCCWGCKEKLNLERPDCSRWIMHIGCTAVAFLQLRCPSFPGHGEGKQMGSCWQQIGWKGKKKPQTSSLNETGRINIFSSLGSWWACGNAGIALG